MEILSLPENEPFITGIEESIDICSNQIMKLADASIFHCRSGKAHIEIDLQAYEVTENTQLLLLPGSIFNCTCASHDFTVSYIVFSDTLFREITSRLDPSFFHFLKEHPCIVIPEERVKPFIGLSLVMKDLYEDRDNSFRIQIFKISFKTSFWTSMTRPNTCSCKKDRRNKSPGRDIQTFHPINS